MYGRLAGCANYNGRPPGSHASSSAVADTQTVLTGGEEDLSTNTFVVKRERKEKLAALSGYERKKLCMHS